MVKKKTKKRLSWTLYLLGLGGVIVPHVAFLTSYLPDLSTVSHATFELISAGLLIGGYLLK